MRRNMSSQVSWIFRLLHTYLQSGMVTNSSLFLLTKETIPNTKVARHHCERQGVRPARLSGRVIAEVERRKRDYSDFIPILYNLSSLFLRLHELARRKPE